MNRGRSNCREVTVKTRRYPAGTGQVRLHVCSLDRRFECHECGEYIEPGDTYEYRVVRVERTDPRTMRYASHLEYRRKHDSCPEKER
jgi:hypothetical protein